MHKFKIGERLFPHTLTAASESDGGGPVEFQRVIVWPNGHREIEGKTPKQLPAPPDAGAT